MRFRCARCGDERADPTRATEHVVRVHGCSDFGWWLERVPETRAERPVAWLSNLPLRVRDRWLAVRDRVRDRWLAVRE